MNNIDIKKRKDFQIGEFFDIVNGKKYPKQERESGNLPLVSTSGINNGISDYIKERSDSVYENCITVAYSGSVGYTAYQKNEVFVGETVIALLPKFELNDYIALFLVSILNKHNSEYTYEHKIKVLSYGNDYIKLPVDNEGNPDRKYMENYMKNLEEKCKKELELLKRGRKTGKSKIDTNLWKEFKIGDLFDIHPTKAYKDTNKDLFEEDGKNPVVVNSGFNNGIGGYTNKDCTEKVGTITFTDTAAKSSESFFYQDKDFVGYPHVQGMYSKGHQWNKLESLFLTTSIKAAIKGRYDFIKKMTRDEILKLTIKLPVDSEGNPNRDFMRNYIKNIESKCKINFSNLKN